MEIFHVSRRAVNAPSRLFFKRAGELWVGDCAFGMAPLLSA